MAPLFLAITINGRKLGRDNYRFIAELIPSLRINLSPPPFWLPISTRAKCGGIRTEFSLEIPRRKWIYNFLFLSFPLFQKKKKKIKKESKRRNFLSRTIQKLNNSLSSGLKRELKRIPTGLSICRGNGGNGLGRGGEARESFFSGERSSVLLLISSRQQISRERG